MSENGQEKVAVLGGGIGSLSSAFELSKQKAPDGSPKYDITVYQLGWRLGGKLATSRNEEKGMRIEEHGIHGFMGFYYNAGVLMSEVFKNLRAHGDEDGFYTTFDQAFIKQSSCVMWEFLEDRWTPWLLEVPNNDRDFDNFEGLQNYEFQVVEVLKLLGVTLQRLVEKGHLHGHKTAIEEIVELIEKEVPHLDHIGAWAIKLVGKIWAMIKPALEESHLLTISAEVRHLYLMIDFNCALLTGFFADHIPTEGFASIDHINFYEWLNTHGASSITLASPIAQNTPDITYNFPDSDMTLGGRMSASAYLQWSLRFFAYVGAFVLAFRSGTGETVLSPIYKALKNNGVKFEFFQKVENLKLAADKRSVESVSIDVQAEVTNEEYSPLFRVKELMCWPSKPLYDQLVNGEALEKANVDLESWWTDWKPVSKRELVAGQDFDHIILGISVGALPYICSEMIADDSNKPIHGGPNDQSRWKMMVDRVETVQTQAMQLWFQNPVAEYLDQTIKLPVNDGVKDEWIAGTYVLPVAGQADFSHLLPVEDWPADGPGGIFYLCGPMRDSGIPEFTDHEFPKLQSERVKAQCIQYLEACMSPVLPNGSTEKRSYPTTPGSLDFDLLYDPTKQKGEARFDWQFWRANIDPTERYVTSFPGAGKYRLKSWDSGYENLTLAGDWIDTGLHVGSVEGAVMGGKLASHAVSGLPSLADVYGYEPFTTSSGS